VVQYVQGGTPEPEDAALWAEGLGLTFPVFADTTGPFFETWDPAGILPMSFIIDPDGAIHWTEAGGPGALEEIEAELTALLGN
jgi:peroxiredoxin